MKKIHSGYILQLYQYAKKYSYNEEAFIEYFNKRLEKDNEWKATDYLTFGEFDALEISPVNSFREYHDISDLAKKWLGKRQEILLYDISDNENKNRFYYDSEQKEWKSINSDENIQKKFFA